MLPHIWNDGKDIRFFADEYEEMEIGVGFSIVTDERLSQSVKA